MMQSGSDDPNRDHSRRKRHSYRSHVQYRSQKRVRTSQSEGMDDTYDDLIAELESLSEFDGFRYVISGPGMPVADNQLPPGENLAGCLSVGCYFVLSYRIL